MQSQHIETPKQDLTQQPQAPPAAKSVPQAPGVRDSAPALSCAAPESHLASNDQSSIARLNAGWY